MREWQNDGQNQMSIYCNLVTMNGDGGIMEKYWTTHHTKWRREWKYIWNKKVSLIPAFLMGNNRDICYHWLNHGIWRQGMCPRQKNNALCQKMCTKNNQVILYIWIETCWLRYLHEEFFNFTKFRLTIVASYSQVYGNHARNKCFQHQHNNYVYALV